ncbi:MAG TPA: alanine racemase [Luteimonas sp.]|nr:alanine racemase [Luteimonas sp.]HRP72002.1 alanine racemase [Luteimonas sp.]
MHNDRPAPFSRRRFIAATAGAAVALALPARAAPLLNLQDRKRSLASNAWIEVDPAVFEHNLQLIQAMLSGGARTCAVMKADAYGTGIDLVMPSVIQAGIPYVGIASTEEARMARACGFKGRLMRVRPATSVEIEAALPHEVEELVGGLDAAREVARIAGKRRRRRPARVHLALNSAGMSRNGLELGNERGRREAQAIVATEGLRIVGLMTHFPGEEVPDLLHGVETFKRETAWLFANTALRREDVLLHAANSFAIQHVPESHLDMVRPGGALYGYGGTPKPPFVHVASFRTSVASVQAYPAGSTVSYDRTFTLQRDSLLANLPVGYSDGYRRAYSNKGSVLVRGRRAPVVGRVTMNTTMVDVTDIAGVEPGDEVVLFGRQGEDEITQAQIEEVTGVILADQYTVWGSLNPKVLRR